MLETQNFALYFNLFFFGLIGLGMLIGFILGLKTTLYRLIVKVIFYIIFFATLNAVVALIWRAPIPNLGNTLGAIDGAFSGVRTLREALPIAMEMMLGDTLNATLENENFLAFATSLSLFVVKIVYTIFYFTVFKLIYNIIFFVIRIIFFRTKKEDKFKSKKRLPAMAVGAASGLVSVFVTLILLGGIMDVSTNLVSLLDENDETVELASGLNNNDNGNGIEVPDELEEEVGLIRDMTDAYNNNVIVRNVSRWTHTDPETERETPQNLRLFDMVFSIDYRDHSIRFRHEISVVADISNVMLNSEFARTQNMSDLSGDEFRQAFTHLSSSELFVAILPLGIEMAADYTEMELPIDSEALYAIDWRNEVTKFGAIASTGIDILHAAGVFDEDDAYETAVFDGDDFRTLFNDVSESEIFTLGATAGMDILLDMAGEDMAVVLDVPEGVVWEDEFKAFGEIIGSFADTEVTIRDVREQDYNEIFQKLSTMDMQVILDSRFIENAMINVLSGKGDLMDVEQLLVPDDVAWRDVYDGDTRESDGELRKILIAVNALTAEAANLDFEALDINLVLDFDESLFDTVFESAILEASIGNLAYELSADIEELVIPKSILKIIVVDGVDRDIVSKDEILSLIDTVRLINIDDFENLAFDASILADLSDEDIPNLFDSKIIHATLSQVILDMADEEDAFMVVPYFDVDEVMIRFYDEDDELDYVTVDELSDLLRAFLSLDITENFDDFDAINLDLINENIDALLDSAILHATVSKQLFDLGEDTVTIPHFAEDENPIRVVSGVDDEATEYVIKLELKATLEALETLDILDVDGFEGGVALDMLDEEENRQKVLASSILQATISKQLIDMHEDAGNETVIVPLLAEDDTTEIRKTVGENDTETEYVVQVELDALLEALVVLGITDNIDEFDGGVDLSVLEDQDNRTKVLASSILQATISKQLIDMHEDAGNETIVVPLLAEDGTTEIRKTVGENDTETEYVVQVELDALLEALVVLGITDNIDEFDGGVDLSALEDQDNRTKVLASSILQATISKQLLDLDADETIVVPLMDEDDANSIRITVGPAGNEVDYVLSGELDNLLEGLVILGITDNVDQFDGGVNLDAFSEDRGNIDIVFASSILQATVSKQLLDMAEGPDPVINVPYFDEDEDTEIRLTVSGDDYILKEELNKLMNALVTLELTDNVDAFDGNVDLLILEDTQNRSEVLSSSIIQATISDQVIDMQAAGTIDVPHREEDDDSLLRKRVGDSTENTETEFVVQSELDALIRAVITLMKDETTETLYVEDFGGNINLEILGEEPDPGEDANRDIVLSSHIIRATMSKQMLDSASLNVPQRDAEDSFDVTVEILSGEPEAFTYIALDELTRFIDVLIMFEAYDIEAYDGAFDLGKLDSEENQTTLLDSAIMHATISETLLDLDDAVLIVPTYMQDDSTLLRFVISATEFVLDDEIRLLIDAFLAMGYSDLDTFGSEIESERFFDNREVLLLSSAIRATISDKLINDTGDNLLIPDEDINANIIRITVDNGAYTYIEENEMDHIFDALELLDLKTFSEVELTSELVLGGVDIATLLESVSIQLTLSDIILPNTQDENDAIELNPMTLIVTTNFHQSVDVEGVATTQIEKDELQKLLDGLELLGADFDGAMDAQAVSGAIADIDTILESGSLHVTIDNMIKSNAAIDVPDLATIPGAFNELEDVTTAIEIERFIIAADIVTAQTGSGDFTNVDFDLEAINNLSESEQETVIESMIVRNVLTDQIETFIENEVPLVEPEDYFDETDYEEDDRDTFLREQPILDFLDEYGDDL